MEPSFHSTEDFLVKFFLFSSYPKELVNGGDVTLRVGSDISTRDELFERYSAGLSFPDYFGWNWDALDECLRDLHWVRQKRVIILHDDLPRLPENEMRVYLQILARAVEDWRKNEEHELIVVFPKRAEHHVRELIRSREA